MLKLFKKITPFILCVSGALQAETPDISNLNNCVIEVRRASNVSPQILNFDAYAQNYKKLIYDLQMATPELPYIYQEAAAKPLIRFLTRLGENQYLQIFRKNSSNENLKEIISDAALAVLFQYKNPETVSAFQEVVSDLYSSFIKDQQRTAKDANHIINEPNYGIIPPLVKYGNPEYGPYTWTGDATYQILGMGCAIVSLPPAQLQGGLIAWSSLGHETSGHDIMHADIGLLDELAANVERAILKKFNSQPLADYWVGCIDETVADVCGYLNMGPSAGIGLIGYFRALGNGRLSNIGYKGDPHPIDLLRGYLAAAVAKRLNFKEADLWSEVITQETNKDARTLFLINQNGGLSSFPVSLETAIASTEVVAKTIMRSSLATLENHTLQGIQNWNDNDQDLVDLLSFSLQTEGDLPKNLQGPGFYAAHVVAAAIQTALKENAEIRSVFKEMQKFLAEMHLQNPLWSTTPTEEAIHLLEMRYKNLSTQVDVKPSIGFKPVIACNPQSLALDE